MPQATNHTYGGRVGGPIILPGFDGRGRAFFFFNQEEVYSPIETPRTRTIIRQSALDGNFSYGTGAPFTTVNVLALAAANGQVSAYDPTVMKLLEDDPDGGADDRARLPKWTRRRTRPATTGWCRTRRIRHTPTTNITVNLTPKNRLQGSYYWQRFNNTPDTLNSADPAFPGFPAFGDQTSYRTTASISLRSTMSTAIVNEVRGGLGLGAGQLLHATPTPACSTTRAASTSSLGLRPDRAPAPGNANFPEQRNTPNVTVVGPVQLAEGLARMSVRRATTRT